MQDNASIVAAAVAEITTPTFGVTEQFLKVHSVALKGDCAQVAGVLRFDEDSLTIVYFAVEGEKFYLALSVSTAEPEPAVIWVWIEEWNRISFQVTSESLDSEQLLALTSLKPTDHWNKGDQRRFGGALRKQSSIEFEPYPGPGEFGFRLKKLLSFLEQDPTGIRALVDQTEGYLRVISVFHNANTMLGGLHLDKECIQRMAALNLEIDFDLYAEGNFY